MHNWNGGRWNISAIGIGYFEFDPLYLRVYFTNFHWLLCSIFILNAVIIPALEWILPDDCSKFNSQLFCSFASLLKFYSFLRLRLIQLFYVRKKPPCYLFIYLFLNILWLFQWNKRMKEHIHYWMSSLFQN